MGPSKPHLNSTEELCLHLPPHIDSHGIWIEEEERRGWLDHSLPLMELQIVLFCSTMAVVHFFLKRFGVSKLSCQIITGLIFGCSWTRWNVAKTEIFTESSEDILGLVGYFGFALYLFLTAVKMDVTMAARTGKKAFIIGIPTMLVPLMGGLIFETVLVSTKGLTIKEKGYIPLLVSIHALTSFPVIASLLSELQIVHSELGRLGLSTALVCDMLSITVMSIFKLVGKFKQSPREGWIEFVGSLFYCLVVVYVFKPAMYCVIKLTPQGKPIRRSYCQGIITLAIFSIAYSLWIGQSSIFAPYVLGLAVPDGAPLGSTLVEKVDCILSDVFMPMLVISCALRVNLSELSTLFSNAFTNINVVVVLITLLLKITSCFLSSWHCNLPFKDSVALSLILSCKGVVELVFYTMLRDLEDIDEGNFGCFTLITLLVATLFPIAVRSLYDPSRKYAGYQNRNIMSLNPNTELRILTCVHQNDNIYGLIQLLNISCPTIENPVGVYVLHLIELIGRTTPIFISHRLQNRSLSKKNNQLSYADTIILSFDQFQKENQKSVYVECFTGVTPSKFMHEDICTLALDKVASLIILPFHRTWTVDGFIDQEDSSIRSLNNSVLERAPCSVGILVDRGHLGRIASMASTEMIHDIYSVSMIFLGGEDDREALSFAKRMINDLRVHLTVIRIVSTNEQDESNNWETMLDSEVIRDFKFKCLGDDGSLRFVEEISNDGTQTALILRTLVNEFDLMIVGRRCGVESRQTSGLSEWNDFPELGNLGDLIASTDINNRTSVLVIQKQITTVPQ